MGATGKNIGCLKPKAESAIVCKNAVRKDLLMELHMKEFDGTTFGMCVKASSLAFRRMKKNAYRAKITPHGSHFERTAWCVKASDVAASMGEAGWLACKRNSVYAHDSMG